jgi:hypothetical protein
MLNASTRRLLAAATFVAASMTQSSLAAPENRFYVGPTNGNWNNPANWSTSEGGAGGASVPTDQDSAFVTQSADASINLNVDYPGPGLSVVEVYSNVGTPSVPAADVTLRQVQDTVTIFGKLNLARTANTRGTYFISGGTLRLSGVNNPDGLFIGEAGEGRLRMTGNSVTTVGGNVFLGMLNGSSGIINHRDTAALTIGSDTLAFGHRNLVLGRDAGATGAYFLGNNGEAPTSVLTLWGNLTAGESGSAFFDHSAGVVNVKKTIQPDSGNVYFAKNAGASGQLVMRDGTFTAERMFYVGGSETGEGGSAQLTIIGGTLTAPFTQYPNSTINLNGGTLSIGALATDVSRIEGSVHNNNTGTLTLAGRITGNGFLNNGAGNVNILPDTILDSGNFNLSNSSPATFVAPRFGSGVTAGSTYRFNQTDGTFNAGTMGLGNDGTLLAGAGVGRYFISHGKLNAATLLMGSEVGGQGELYLSNSGQIKVTGGMAFDYMEMNGGTFTLENQTPPVGQDPMLDRAFVGGYRVNSDFTFGGGTFSAPVVKLGVTATKTANWTQGGGTATVGTFTAGNDGTLTGGQGQANLLISGGTISAGSVLMGSSAGGTAAVTVTGNGSIVASGGFVASTLTMNNGAITLQDGTQPAGQDPMIDLSLVAGYQHSGAININAGTLIAPKVKLGITTGTTGTYNQTSGVANIRLFTAGNDGTTTGGAGTGTAIVTGNGVLNVGTVLLGSSTGGSGSLTITGAGTPQINVSGGVAANTLTVDGGTLTVASTGPLPPGQDTALDRSIVAGYTTNGTVNVSNGVLNTPNLKIGFTAAKTGTFNQTGGTANVTTRFTVGNSATTGAGNATVSGGAFVAASTNVEANGLLTMAGGALNTGALAINDGGKVAIATGTPVRILKVTSLTIDTPDGSQLDVASGSLLLDYDGASPLTQVREYLRSGLGTGNWLGGGITSSTAIANNQYAVAYGEASDFGISGIYNGVFLSGAAIVTKTTLGGDIDVSFTVDFNDLLTLAQNYNTASGATWLTGDVNYDGAVNFNDLLALAQNYNDTALLSDPASVTNFAADFAADWALAVSLVPEPAVLSIVGLAGLIARRRR